MGDSFLEMIEFGFMNGEEFRTAQCYGYLTLGGTYIVGSSAEANDDDKDHDLMAITPWFEVWPLRPTAYIADVTRKMKGLRGRVDRAYKESGALVDDSDKIHLTIHRKGTTTTLDNITIDGTAGLRQGESNANNTPWYDQAD